jgi:ABC-type multidrug transport system ATPase subunit
MKHCNKTVPTYKGTCHDRQETGDLVKELEKVLRCLRAGPINLDVQAGYAVAIVGPNGGGKSTLMGMLMNLIQPTSGEITLFGGKYPYDKVAAKQRIGYAPERP